MSPRPFAERERARIESRLLAAGRELFERQGLRRTSVAELAAAAGIGKGSFYLFFPGKEALFLAIVDRFEAQLKAEMVAELEALDAEGADATALLRRYFELHFRAFEDHPLLAILTAPDELEALVRKVGPERFAAEAEKDAQFFAGLIARWQAEGRVDAQVDPRTVATLSRAVLALLIQRELIGAEEWPPMVELLIDALARRLAKDPEGKEP